MSDQPAEHARSQRFVLAPVPEPFARVYRRRGLTVPQGHSGHSLAALWPYLPRWIHRWYAGRHGLFWIPCPLCLRPFGGHEIVDSIPDPIHGEGRYMSVCPACTAERNGGRP